jgi:hypothetical protein
MPAKKTSTTLYNVEKTIPMAAGTASRIKCFASEPVVKSYVLVIASQYASMMMVSISFSLHWLMNWLQVTKN